MNINGNELRKNDVILVDTILWQCLVSTHRTPGNLRAFIQAKMRNLRDGTQKEFRFSSTEKLEKVDVFDREMQFLFVEGDVYTFMDTENYEQVEMSKAQIGESVGYLKAECVINVSFYEGKPVTVRFPNTMEFTVASCDPEIKGATAAASFKSATLDNGLDIQVPQFVREGDTVKINTETGEYLERVKK